MNTNLKWKPNRTTATLSAALTLVALGIAQTGHAQNLFEADQGGGNINEFTPGGTKTIFAYGNEPAGLAFQPASAPEASTVFDVLGGLVLGGAGLLLCRRQRAQAPTKRPT